jgi:hypothetical protein
MTKRTGTEPTTFLLRLTADHYERFQQFHINLMYNTPEKSSLNDVLLGIIDDHIAKQTKQAS